MTGPVLFCFDGSDGSLRALRDGGGLLRPGAAVILTVWEAVATQLATGSFGFTAGVSYLPDETELDAREEAAARQAAAGGVEIAERHGWEATARVERAVEPVWQTVVWVAEEINASLIVCGARGRTRPNEPFSGAFPRPCSITVTVPR
jgi:nucleotide-binding universal stress UspA family protein